jgi:ketosteroid isomerase-like protein
MRRNDDLDSANTGRRALQAMACTAPALLASVAHSAEPSSGAATELPRDLVQALNAYHDAALRSDVATLAELVADDYMLVNSDTTVQDKASYLGDFAVPGFRVDRYAMQEPIHKVWGEIALTGGIFDLQWIQGDASHARLLRIAHVWIKRERRWRLTYTQLTRVPQ